MTSESNKKVLIDWHTWSPWIPFMKNATDRRMKTMAAINATAIHSRALGVARGTWEAKKPLNKTSLKFFSTHVLAPNTVSGYKTKTDSSPLPKSFDSGYTHRVRALERLTTIFTLIFLFTFGRVHQPFFPAFERQNGVRFDRDLFPQLSASLGRVFELRVVALGFADLASLAPAERVVPAAVHLRNKIDHVLTARSNSQHPTAAATY